MASNKHRPEEALAKLRQVDVLVSQGQSVAEAIRAIGVTEVTYYRWRREFGGFCCNVCRWWQATCEMAQATSHHAAFSNSSAMKLAWARMSRPPMFRSCPFLIIAIAS
jgi:hypothetical protein